MKAKNDLTDELRFYRNGPDHRGGWEVTFKDVRERFGFKSVRIGRWVSEGEKRESASRFYDALCDLMLILGVNESVISLRGSLSLEYGIGGQLGVAAHYQPATRAFALAKNAGPGAIAHEWFHAFDHYISDKAFKLTDECTFGSSAFLSEYPLIEHPLNRCLARCYDTILNGINSDENALVTAAIKADREARMRYYQQPYELCARAFEAFVQDSLYKNSFLVKGTKQSVDAKRGIYPQGAQRLKANQRFSDYFLSLGALTQ